MKDKILILAVILSLGCLVISVKASQTVKLNQNALDQERYKRMTLEEEIQKKTGVINTLENKLASMKKSIENLQTVLEKEQNRNSELKIELSKVTKIKEILEGELKNALVDEPKPAADEQQP